MCGIAGYFVKNFEYSRLPHIQGCISKLKHRGPDDEGINIENICEGHLGFAQTRLAIIDLSFSGHQPMHSSDSRFMIVFNGEIYNYLELRNNLIQLGRNFLTKSDTEVLLVAWQQWGPSCLHKLRGMFAFSILDRLENKIWCARDPFGIKPFYYSWDSGYFMFASETQALISLLNIKPSVNKYTISNYLLNSKYDDDENTFFSSIYQLRPGQLLSIDLDRPIRCEPCWWWRPSITECSGVRFDKASNTLKEKFLDSVQLHLRSDVPFGAALSGGVDSSSIVCAIRYLNPNIKINTFSYVARGSIVDEEKWINLVNNHVNGIPHKLLVHPEDIESDIDDFIMAQSEPTGGVSYYLEYRLYKLAKEAGIKVMLDGHGADEILGGYAGYPTQRIKSLIDTGKYYEAIRFAKRWQQWPGRKSMMALKSMLGAAYSSITNQNPKEALKFVRSINLASMQIFRPSFLNSICFQDTFFHELSGRSLASELHRELSSSSCPPQLRSADRSAMRRSIENRVPFLDPDFVKYALTLPESYIVSDEGLTKSIFRHAMRGIVPSQILDRVDKIGYAAPSGQVISNCKSLLQSVERSCDRFPYLNKKVVMRIITGDGKPSISLEGISWRIFNLLRWAHLNDFSE